MSFHPLFMRRPRAGHRFRLICFAYAGGNAATFLPWQDQLDPAIEVCAVQLPGRGARLLEPAPTAFEPLVRSLAEEIARLPPMPFALFGHSLGGLLAFEVARQCALRQLPQPRHLIVSGCNAPQCRGASRQLHRLPDDQLIEELRAYNGTPAEVLANGDLMALMLPTIRADFALVDSYRYRPGLRLNLPVTVFAGTGDTHCQPEQVSAWERETAAPCRVDWFDGDHFFIHDQQAAVLAHIGQALALPQLAPV
jgi:medium-chain acyl-[acyl-carrier-protein] hydrolase